MRELSLRRPDVSDSRHHHTKALIYVTAVELSQSTLTCSLFSLSPNAYKAIWTTFNSNSLMCNWLSVPDHEPWVVSPSKYAPQPFFDASVLVSMTGFPCDIGLKALPTFSIHQARSSFTLGDRDMRAS